MQGIIIFIFAVLYVTAEYKVKRLEVQVFDLISRDKDMLNIIDQEIKGMTKKEAKRYLKNRYKLTSYSANEIIKRNY